MVGPAAVLTLLLVTLNAGCGTPPGPFLPDSEAARSRMLREFGMTPPIDGEVQPGMDDGGTRSYRFVDRDGVELVVYADGRPVRLSGDAASDRIVLDRAARRPLYLHAYPETEDAVPITIGSPAESAIADLAWSAFHSANTRERVDQLDREDDWVRATDLRGRVQRERILMRRSDHDIESLGLRDFAWGIERKRARVLTGEHLQRP